MMVLLMFMIHHVGNADGVDEEGDVESDGHNDSSDDLT
jgi:hypothetical protein